MKYCKNLWSDVNKEFLIHEGVNLRRRLKQAID